MIFKRENNPSLTRRKGAEKWRGVDETMKSFQSPIYME